MSSFREEKSPDGIPRTSLVPSEQKIQTINTKNSYRIVKNNYEEEIKKYFREGEFEWEREGELD